MAKFQNRGSFIVWNWHSWIWPWNLKSSLNFPWLSSKNTIFHDHFQSSLTFPWSRKKINISLTFPDLWELGTLLLKKVDTINTRIQAFLYVYIELLCGYILQILLTNHCVNSPFHVRGLLCSKWNQSKLITGSRQIYYSWMN